LNLVKSETHRNVVIIRLELVAFNEIVNNDLMLHSNILDTICYFTTHALCAPMISVQIAV